MKSKNRKPCIYAVQSISTKKIYIGQSVYGITQRKKNHLKNRFKANSGIDLALRDLGPEDFVWEIIYLIEDETLDKEEIVRILNEKERYYIEKFNSIKEGYNISEGGDNTLKKYKTWEEKDQAHKKRHKLRKLDKERYAKYLATKKAAREKRIAKNPESYKTKIKIQNNKRKKLKLQQKRAKALNMTLEEYLIYREKKNHLSKIAREKKIAKDPEGYKAKRDEYKKLNQKRDSARKKEYRKNHPEYRKKQRERRKARSQRING